MTTTTDKEELLAQAKATDDRLDEEGALAAVGFTRGFMWLYLLASLCIGGYAIIKAGQAYKPDYGMITMGLGVCLQGAILFVFFRLMAHILHQLIKIKNNAKGVAQ